MRKLLFSNAAPAETGSERLRFLDGILGVASPNTLVSRSRYLLQCRASINAASGGGDFWSRVR
eukprot:1013445-Pleurochrysis_carterae.AAC.1